MIVHRVLIDSAPRRSHMGWALIAILGLGSIGCATTQQQVAQKEDYLAAAGFTVRPADTPARQKMLISLPSHRFVQRPHKDSISYISGPYGPDFGAGLGW